MSFICSISGSPLVQGVICSKTGHLYQKSTILTHIRTFGNCPHSQQPLKQSDLVSIKTQNNSFFTQNKSVNEYMQKLSNEYDSLILQAHYEKQNLQKNRQELAVSLYRQDASLRVIAKLKQQINEKKQQLASAIEQIVSEKNLKQGGGGSNSNGVKK